MHERRKRDASHRHHRKLIDRTNDVVLNRALVDHVLEDEVTAHAVTRRRSLAQESHEVFHVRLADHVVPHGVLLVARRTPTDRIAHEHAPREPVDRGGHIDRGVHHVLASLPNVIVDEPNKHLVRHHVTWHHGDEVRPRVDHEARTLRLCEADEDVVVGPRDIDLTGSDEVRKKPRSHQPTVLIPDKILRESQDLTSMPE